MLIIGIIVGALFQFDIEERIDPDRLLDIVPEGLSTLFIVIASVLSFLLLLVLLRLLGIIWYLLRFHGYRLSRCGNELRIACGLLTKVSAVVPLRRIQFISVHRPWILRWMGYASIRIETAGGSGTDKEDPASTVSRRWFAPVLPEHRVSELLGCLGRTAKPFRAVCPDRLRCVLS
jgi:putative membrane protein